MSGKNILEIMTLGAESGSSLDLTCIGPDAEAAATALVELVENDFHENQDEEEGAGQGEVSAQG